MAKKERRRKKVSLSAVPETGYRIRPWPPSTQVTKHLTCLKLANMEAGYRARHQRAAVCALSFVWSASSIYLLFGRELHLLHVENKVGVWTTINLRAVSLPMLRQAGRNVGVAADMVRMLCVVVNVGITTVSHARIRRVQHLVFCPSLYVPSAYRYS